MYFHSFLRRSAVDKTNNITNKSQFLWMSLRTKKFIMNRFSAAFWLVLLPLPGTRLTKFMFWAIIQWTEKKSYVYAALKIFNLIDFRCKQVTENIIEKLNKRLQVHQFFIERRNAAGIVVEEHIWVSTEVTFSAFFVISKAGNLTQVLLIQWHLTSRKLSNETLIEELQPLVLENLEFKVTTILWRFPFCHFCLSTFVAMNERLF